MIHTKVTPNDVLVNVSFYVPKSYIGKEIDIIAFSSNEGIQKSIPEWHKPILDKTLDNLKTKSKSTKSWKQLKKELDNEIL